MHKKKWCQISFGAQKKLTVRSTVYLTPFSKLITPKVGCISGFKDNQLRKKIPGRKLRDIQQHLKSTTCRNAMEPCSAQQLNILSTNSCISQFIISFISMTYKILACHKKCVLHNPGTVRPVTWCVTSDLTLTFPMSGAIVPKGHLYVMGLIKESFVIYLLY